MNDAVPTVGGMAIAATCEAAARARDPGAAGIEDAAGGECLIIFRRRVVAQEVAAISLALADAGMRVRLLCPGPKLLQSLPSEVRAACASSVLGGPDDSNQEQALSPQHARLRRWLRPRLVASVVGGIRLALALARDRRVARRWLRRRQTRALIVFEDRVPVPEMAFLREARRAGVPSLLVPFAASSPEGDAWSRSERAGYDLDRGFFAGVRRLAGQIWPNHTHRTSYGRLLFFRVPDMLALALHGMSGTNVWFWGGGEADRILLFGPADRDKLAAFVTPSSRIVITGQASLDALHRAHADRANVRARLRQVYGLGADTPLLVLASPTWGEHSLASWDEHWRLTSLLYRALANCNADVLVSLHPKSVRGNYEPLAHECGLHILDERLTEALPAADIFVAAWSSTLRWAALLGIPAVNLALISSDAVDYGSLPSMLTIRSENEIASTLRNLVEDGALRQSIGEALRAQSASIEILDGRSSQRVVDALLTLCASRSFSASSSSTRPPHQP